MRIKILLRILIISIILLVNSCTDNPVNNIFSPSYSPIWPQPGFNARNTSNPSAPSAYMNPVIQGIADWSYTFPPGSFSDGAEFCVDSKGNIYYLNQLYSTGGLYKFRFDGTLVWKIDSLMQNNYCGISLSADEKKIYLSAYKIQPYAEGLYCVDSGGTIDWYIPGCTDGAKPVIGRDGIIYTFKDFYLTALSSTNVVWTSPNITQVFANTKISLDESDNLYLTQSLGIVKASKTNGDVIWQYTTGTFTQGIVIDGFGNVYFNGFSNDTLYCLNKNGQLKWSKPNTNKLSTPVISKDNKIFISTGNDIVAYDTAGNEIWKKPAFNDGGGAEGLMLDDEDNIYYIRDMNGITAGSISKTGQFRWQTTEAFNLSFTLPPPVLIPQGKMLFAPKRAWKIQAIK